MSNKELSGFHPQKIIANFEGAAIQSVCNQNQWFEETNSEVLQSNIK